MTDFRGKALNYLDNLGAVCHPLRENDQGIAKVAIVPAWQTLTADRVAIAALPWEQAKGIGILGGSASGGLAFIDVDDEALAAEVVAYYVRSHKNPLLAFTARRRCHVYVIEPKPTTVRHLKLVYQGRDVKVDLIASGGYVAAPPTPGYLWMNADFEPLYTSLSDAWTELAIALEVTFPNQGSQAMGKAGYPTSWAAKIGQGERNAACFYESSCLKDARMPREQAWAVMEARINQAYELPVDWHELRRTFESAYRRGVSVATTPVGNFSGGVGL